MNATLLIAESDAELSGVYRKFFSKSGYTVETASSGLDCLERLRRIRPVAIVLERELPWGGGDGVLAWLRQEESLSEVPVILTATAGYAAEGTQAHHPPIVRFLPKPFTLSALLENVRAAERK
jgi:two-component system response regulator MprA